MNMIKKLTALLMAFIMLFALASCGSKTEDPSDTDETITSYKKDGKARIATVNNGLGLAMTKFNDDKDERAYTYEVTFADSNDKAVAMLEKGEADIATITLDSAAQLYNKTNGGYQILAVCNVINYFIFTLDTETTSVKDFKGKTVYCAQKDECANAVLTYIMTENGMSKDDIKIEYVDTYDELISLVKSGKAENIFAAEPYATKIYEANKKLIAYSLYNGWIDLGDTAPVYACLVAKKDFISANKELITEFITYYEVAVNFMAMRLEKTLYEIKEKNKYDSIDDAELSITLSNMAYIEGSEMKEHTAVMLEALNKVNPDLIGGKLPAEDFYYIP